MKAATHRAVMVTKQSLVRPSETPCNFLFPPSCRLDDGGTAPWWWKGLVPQSSSGGNPEQRSPSSKHQRGQEDPSGPGSRRRRPTNWIQGWHEGGKAHPKGVQLFQSFEWSHGRQQLKSRFMTRCTKRNVSWLESQTLCLLFTSVKVLHVSLGV